MFSLLEAPRMFEHEPQMDRSLERTEQAQEVLAPVKPKGLEMPSPARMFVGGVVGFGLLYLALYWSSRRGG